LTNILAMACTAGPDGGGFTLGAGAPASGPFRRKLDFSNFDLPQSTASLREDRSLLYDAPGLVAFVT
jgi:hypothetical protein